jgi:hypothetical protein
MKHLFFCFILFISAGSYAQDTIYFKNNEKLRILLLEVNPDNVKYKRFDNQAGATYTVLKSEISFITLSNGKKEVFDKTSTEKTVVVKDSVPVQPKDTLAVQTPTVTKPITANDTIYFKNGKKVPSRIYELTDTDVKYKPIGNLDGPVYKVPKSDVREIVFSTGMKQKFETQPVFNPVYTNETGGLSSSRDFWTKGVHDAQTNYRHKGGSVAIGIVSIVPLIGLVPAIICSAVPPKQHNLNYPSDALWQNKDYKNGYQNEAYRMKRRRIWRAFGIGACTGVLIAILSG